MTSDVDNTWIVESDIPVPKRSGYERLPKDTSQRLLDMAVGEAMFLPTKDRDHAKRRAQTIRSHIRRVTDENPEYRFRVYISDDEGNFGVRVWRDELGEDNEPSQSAGSGSPSSDEGRLHERQEQ
jgi:hypothetical protein